MDGRFQDLFSTTFFHVEPSGCFFWGDGSHLKGEVCFDFLLVRRRYKYIYMHIIYYILAYIYLFTCIFLILSSKNVDKVK